VPASMEAMMRGSGSSAWGAKLEPRLNRRRSLAMDSSYLAWRRKRPASGSTTRRRSWGMEVGGALGKRRSVVKMPSRMTMK
jgi:hypothetical protein